MEAEKVVFYRIREPYGAFSNFFRRSIRLEGKTWCHSEGYYQAKKRAGTPHEEIVRNLQTPREAADYGRRQDIPLRADWDQVKEEVMSTVLRAKFGQHEDLRLLLLSTGNKEIIEHSKKDSYWGDGGDGTGLNRLGKLLVQLREELKVEKNMYDQTPCPKCWRNYRFTLAKDPKTIICDDCGYQEKANGQDEES